MPYIGYFQLISAVDVFVLYDNIKYTKKGWINRNRMLMNGSDKTFSLPLKQASDYHHVVQRKLSEEYNRAKLLAQFKGAYEHAPYFCSVVPLLQRIVEHTNDNLFAYIYHSLDLLCSHLGINTKIIASSCLEVNPDLRGKDRVIALCDTLFAKKYINPIGGVDLYDKHEFLAHGIKLEFLKSRPFAYNQFENLFVPSLSIVDVLMFNSIDRIQELITFGYDLL